MFDLLEEIAHKNRRRFFIKKRRLSWHPREALEALPHRKV